MRPGLRRGGSATWGLRLRWSGESGWGQVEPFERAAMVEAFLLRRRQAECGDARTRLLLAERERIVGTEHDAAAAGDVEQVAQRALIVHAGIEPDAVEVLARVARVVGRN